MKKYIYLFKKRLSSLSELGSNLYEKISRELKSKDLTTRMSQLQVFEKKWKTNATMSQDKYQRKKSKFKENTIFKIYFKENHCLWKKILPTIKLTEVFCPKVFFFNT